MSLTKRILAALALGIACGFLVRAHPTPVLLKLVNVVEPIGTLWVNAIRMTVVPLVVSLLITGVASSSNISAVRGIGWRALASFLGLSVFCAVIALLIVPPLFSWFHMDPSTIASLGGSPAGMTTAPAVLRFSEWIVDIVPTNPIRAANDGAMLPLVVFALMFGLALLKVTAKGRDAVINFFQAVGDAMLVIVGVIIDLAPIGVFALMLPVVSRTGIAAAGSLVYYLVVMVIVSVVQILSLYPLAAAIGRVSMIRFAQAIFAPQAIALTSSSSLASLPALLESGNRRLQLPPNVTGMVLPLAVSMFKASGAASWLVAAIFLARLYGVQLAPTQLVVIALTAILTSFSVPGVPHGWLLVISPLIVTMGIPSAGIGLLIAVDSIADPFLTTVNVTADLAAAVLVSRDRVVARTAELPDAEAARTT